MGSGSMVLLKALGEGPSLLAQLLMVVGNLWLVDASRQSPTPSSRGLLCVSVFKFPFLIRMPIIGGRPTSFQYDLILA